MNMMDFLIGAGLLCLVILPGAVVALLGTVWTIRRLEERNAAQGQIIAGLQKRLTGKMTPGRAIPPPRGDWPPMRGDDAESIRAVERRLFGDCPTCGSATGFVRGVVDEPR